MRKSLDTTKTKEDVQGLVEKLLGPLSTEDFGFADFTAAKDKLALYQGLAVIFPEAARNAALAKLDGSMQKAVIAQIADWASLPLSLTELVLSARWPSLRDDILNC